MSTHAKKGTSYLLFGFLLGYFFEKSTKTAARDDGSPPDVHETNRIKSVWYRRRKVIFCSIVLGNCVFVKKHKTKKRIDRKPQALYFWRKSKNRTFDKRKYSKVPRYAKIKFIFEFVSVFRLVFFCFTAPGPRRTQKKNKKKQKTRPFFRWLAAWVLPCSLRECLV